MTTDGRSPLLEVEAAEAAPLAAALAGWMRTPRSSMVTSYLIGLSADLAGFAGLGGLGSRGGAAGSMVSTISLTRQVNGGKSCRMLAPTISATLSSTNLRQLMLTSQFA